MPIESYISLLVLAVAAACSFLIIKNARSDSCATNKNFSEYLRKKYSIKGYATFTLKIFLLCVCLAALQCSMSILAPQS